MIRGISIPRKLAVSFFVIIGTAAVMLAVFFANVWMIRDATEDNNRAQTIYAKALTLETSLLRENSQLRGYLVTGDKSYLKSYDEARTEYDRAAAELGALIVSKTDRTASSGPQPDQSL